MPQFSILLRHPMYSFPAPGHHADKHEFHYVADIEAENTDDAFAKTQNGNPDFIDPTLRVQPNPTLTWAKQPNVTLTSEGERLKCRRLNDSLRSLSVGDILIHQESGEVWMVDSFGFLLAEDIDGYYKVPLQGRGWRGGLHTGHRAGPSELTPDTPCGTRTPTPSVGTTTDREVNQDARQGTLPQVQ